ncbi:MAG: citrate synthase [Breznakibacter sp.]
MTLINKLAQNALASSNIDKTLFDTYNVKRGLRNADFSGVLVGLTNIGDVVGYQRVEDKLEPRHGELYYRGIEIRDLVKGFQSNGRNGFEETAFLLLSGKLPNREELTQFSDYIEAEAELPPHFANSLILSLKGSDVMNMLARSVLGLYTTDPEAEDFSPENLVRQSMALIARLPVITAYSYYGMRHDYHRQPLVIRHPKKGMCLAENFLYMLKGDHYTRLEVDLLDLSLVLHAEHGGGNNSTFTTRVVSSAQTDTYAAIAAALGSLKGGLHGGANLKVCDMMENFKANIRNWGDEQEVEAYIRKILNKQAFDGTGKIYGIGHAIYTLSDPRAVLLKEKARELAVEKNREAEFQLYETIERLAPQIFASFKGAGTNKVVAANVDFYSGFVYQCMNIPRELFTPIFAMARMAGWCAHRIEEVTFPSRRIIRPAYKNVCVRSPYKPLQERQ